jgi:hypothetical protein
VAIFAIEIVNLLVVLESTTYLDVVMNFIQLAVIAEFDNFFYFAIGSDQLKKVIEGSGYDHLYVVTRTSSSRCSIYDGAEDDTYDMTLGKFEKSLPMLV